MIDGFNSPVSLSLQDDRYQVLQILGEGGFGRTFLAEDTQMPSRRKCVIKQLKPMSNNPEIHQLVQERFHREAAILEQLGEEHPQIPRLYAYIQEDEQFYLVEEWVEGQTLTQKVQNGVLDEASVHQILVNLLPVLEYVHRHRIVHRDLKPDNIILRQVDDQPVLIDFGAVKEAMQTVLNPQTQSSCSIIVGTPGYIPSEQLAGRPVYSSDLYSLGLTAIFLLTGKVPQEFETDSTTGQILWQAGITSLSPEFAEVLERAILLQLSHRFTTAPQMLAALSACAIPFSDADESEPCATPLAAAPSESAGDAIAEPTNDLALTPTLIPTAQQESPPVGSPLLNSSLPTIALGAAPRTLNGHASSTDVWKQAVLVGGLIGGSILAGAVLIRAELPGVLSVSQSELSVPPTTVPVAASPSKIVPSLPDPPVRSVSRNVSTNAAIVGKPGTKNIRSGPSTLHEVSGSVSTGSRVQILGNEYDSNGYPWYEVYAPTSNVQGWMASHLVASDDGVSPPATHPITKAPPVKKTLIQKLSKVSDTNATIAGESGGKNIRLGPGTDYSIQFEIQTGSRAQIIGRSQDDGGYLWYEIYIPSANAQGWIAAHLVEVD